MMQLHEVLAAGAAASPDGTAVVHPGRAALSYAELVSLSDRFGTLLRNLGVAPGDRVGLCLHKSVDSVAAIFGILKAGGAYVPVDADAPPERCAYVFNDCSVKVILCERSLAEKLRPELTAAGATPHLLELDDTLPGLRIQELLEREAPDFSEADKAPAVDADPERLAYILYTSGSTGRPKGVMLSQRAAVSFIDWCSATFDPAVTDRFSSHAPFHFDLSILDIYVPLRHGATLVLIDEATGKEPMTLAGVIADQRITVWYSTPSVLNLLAQYGKLARHDYSALRMVLFAGEVFPIPQLRALKAQWPGVEYFNLYGPTETNVCTYFRIPEEIPADRADPFPIGQTCEHLLGRVMIGGADVARGDEGELLIAGPGVMSGYWNLPEQNGRAFVQADGARWYRTGDIVVESGTDGYVFHGRRDRMVKRHGYRIELGEIEAGLARHPSVLEAAVVATHSGPNGSTRIQAFLSLRASPPPSIIEMKGYCSQALPKYMVPDGFTFVDALPRTSTDKIDYRTLAADASPNRPQRPSPPA